MRPLPEAFEIFTTADGSPTLAFKRSDGYVEKMHHTGGALSESVYIYLESLIQATERNWPLRVASIGLGLAYNEWLTLGEAHRRGLDVKIWSFELSPLLREEFLAFLKNARPESEMQTVYAQVADQVAARLNLSPAELKAATLSALNSERLILRGSFPQEIDGLHDISLVYYDAYSRKMDPELWQEEAVTEAFKKILAPQALVATYAATGALNRVLKRLGFSLKPKAGFQGKRESTLAIRESLL
jgi:tRNA U34 5-methylaminomethyl-2-thiouridine-forming methyltransferase MnmC